MVNPKIFLLLLRIWFQRSWQHDPDEKGIRCKTGAVPAAVNLGNLSETPATARILSGWEGIRKRGEPEDLPIIAFGIKARVSILPLSIAPFHSFVLNVRIY